MRDKRKRDLPCDFFDDKKPKATPVASVAEKKDDASAQQEKAFETFLMETKEMDRSTGDRAVVEEEEDKPSDAPLDAAVEDAPDAEDELEYDQLVNKGRAAVWRKLVEERKEATVSKSGKAKEDAEESESESDDGDDLLVDWRSKGI